MRISRLGRFPAAGDIVDSGGNTVAGPDRIYTYFEADGAVAMGAPVQLQVDTNNNSTGNITGWEVVEADTDNPGGGSGTIVGAYQGVNISNPGGNTNVSLPNAAGSTAGAGAVAITGRVAVDGDIIEVICYGQGYVLAHGGTDVVAGDSLIADSTGGRLITVTDLADGSGGLVTALGPITAAGEGLIPAYFRCM